MDNNNITETKKHKPNWTENEKTILLENFGRKTPSKVDIIHQLLMCTTQKPGGR